MVDKHRIQADINTYYGAAPIHFFSFCQRNPTFFSLVGQYYLG